jgi:hypothetical protein
MTMKFRSSSLLVVAASFLWTAAARAQVTGSIVGVVYDQNGSPLKGVKISATSDSQIGGAKVAYSNDEGNFRVPGLQPGVFEVRATAPKLKQVLQRDVHVGINTPAEIELVMEVAAATEEVRVVETAPTVSTTAANLKETYDLDYVATLPLDGLVTKVEPFVKNNTPGAGADGDRYRGGTSRQNQFMVEGFSMMNQRYTMKSLATIEAQTAAYGAENAAAEGAVVNMVTRSGGNNHEFDVSVFYEDNHLSPFLDAADKATRTTRLGINPGFSGPIIKDKLWYYVNIEARHEYRGWPEDPAGFMNQMPPEKVLLGRGSFKFTWQVSPRNKLSSFTLLNRESWANLTDGSYDREFDTAWNSPRASYFTGLTWEGLVTDSLFIRSQVGVQGDSDQWFPQNCNKNPDCFDEPPAEQRFPRTIKLKNYEQLLYNKNTGLELVNTVEWFRNTAFLGDHNVKFVSRYYVRNETSFIGVPGDQKLIYNGALPDRQIEYFSNDPRQAAEARHGYFIRSATGSLLVNSLTDSVRVTRYVSLNLGVALTTAASNTNTGRGTLNLSAFTPHTSVVWDATRDGRTALRASFANYVDADAVRISRYALGNQVARECKWDDLTQSYTKECTYSGGAASVTFGLPCGPQGTSTSGKPCREKLRLPRMWEYTVGAEREIVPGLSLGGDFIHRRFTHPFELGETNRIWNGSGSDLSPTGGYRNGRPERIQDLETPEAASRRYTGMTAVVRRKAGAFKIQMGYTWSKLEGNVDNGGDNNLYGDIGPRDVYLWGYLQDDRRHDIRGTASWQANNWFSVGTTYSYSSGAPYSRTFKNVQTGSFEDYHASIGMDPGGNINDPKDDRPLRLPDIQRLNIKLLGNLKPLTGQNVEAYIDFLNVLNLRTTTAVTTEDGPNYGAPRKTLTPMLIRIGGRYRF